MATAIAIAAVNTAQDEILGEVFIAAPPARVFEAITDPSQVPRWWGQQGIYRVTQWNADLRPGGKWSSIGVGADGHSFRVDGEYLEVDPPRLLVHTWMASWSDGLETVVRWELEPTDVHGLHPGGPMRAGTGTMLKIRHTGFAGVPDAAKNHAEGWTRVLGWMQAYVERDETIDGRAGTK
ncbi:MAG: SRPBCC domain-containing protein [Terriglobales bacterium]|jgi:uncharacterized protein YndB with AHSA1/START domain